MNEPYPANQSAAVTQHMAGNAEHWAPCTGCGAGDAEQCWSLTTRRSAMLGQVVVATGTHKIRPCAGRVWRAAP